MSQGIGGIYTGHGYSTLLNLKEKVDNIFQQFNPASTLDDGDIDSFLQSFVSIDHKDMPQCAEYYKKLLDKIEITGSHINNDIALFKMLIDKITEAKTDNSKLSADELIHSACHKCLFLTIKQHISTYQEVDYKISDPNDSKNDHIHLSRMVSDLQFVSYNYNNAGRMIELECASTLISPNATQAEREDIMGQFRAAIFKEPPSHDLAQTTYDEYGNAQQEQYLREMMQRP